MNQSFRQGQPDAHRRLEACERTYDARAGLIRAGDRHWVGQQSLDYAVLLLRRDTPGDRDRAAVVIGAVLGAQIHEPAWDRGRFPMFLPETWRDLNATLFMAPSLAEIHADHLSKLPGELAARFRTAVREAAEAVDRRWADEVFDVHRDFKAYSNIFVLQIQALMLLGRCLDDERLWRDGEAQWIRWFNHVSTYGIDEFCSPTYNGVVYKGLIGILKASRDDRMRNEARLILDHLSALQHAVSHPVLRMGVVGTSRDYRVFVKPGGGAFTFLGHEGDETYRPPSGVLDEFANRVFPFHASGRAGIVPFRFHTWQVRGAALGSMTGGHYFPQQIHLMAAAGTSPEHRACAFFQADEKNAINGYVRQRGNRALCLFARTPTAYRLTQLRQPADALPLDGTLPPCLGLAGEWTVRSCRTGHLAAAAYGHTLHVRTFRLDGGCPEAVALTPETLDVGGQAVAGWRAPTDAVWFVCLAELLPDGETSADHAVTGELGDRHVTVGETGGLALRLVRRPSGELVELYDEDWRTLPLLDAPAHRIEVGDLAVAGNTLTDGYRENLT